MSYTSGLVDDIMISHNGAHGLESKMFQPVCQAVAPGAKSAVSDCILSWLGSVLWVLFSTLSLLVGWQKGNPAWEKPMSPTPKALLQKKCWKKAEGKPGKRLLKQLVMVGVCYWTVNCITSVGCSWL